MFFRKLTSVLFILMVLFFFLLTQLKSQTQSLWSKVKPEKSDKIGVNTTQYKVPLFEVETNFLDTGSIKYAVASWVVQDFNNDGFADVFIPFSYLEQESIPFLLMLYDKNNGKYIDASHRIKNNIGTPTNRKALCADFNNDGILDMATVSHPELPQYALSYFDIILSNKQDTTWTQKRLRIGDRFKQEGYYHGLAVGDVNNDGYVDVILGETFGFCHVYLNNGKGEFFEKKSTFFDNGKNFKYGAFTLELADINDDGNIDLLYSLDSSNSRLLFGNGKGEFGEFYQNISPSWDFDVRDMDSDGDYDLILLSNDNKDEPTPVNRIQFFENTGKEPSGVIKFQDKSKQINESLKSQGFYRDSSNNIDIGYIHIIDINNDGYYDIIPQMPLSNINTFNKWILLGDDKWNFKYKKLPFAEPPRSIVSSFTDSGKIKLSWQRVIQSFSKSDGGIDKWAVYISNKNWGDRSQVSSPLILSSKDTYNSNGADTIIINPTSNELYIRISAIDSNGIESPLSRIIEIKIPPPAIYSTIVCSDKELTIRGKNFLGIKNITIGGVKVKSYSIVSDSTIRGEINSGQKGNLVLTSVNGELTFIDVTAITPSTESFVIIGKNSILNGSVQSYSVPNTEGVKFSWVFPQGWEQISGSNTNIVTVKANVFSGLIKVIPSAICENLKIVTQLIKVYSYIPDDNFQKALQDIGIDKELKNDSVLTSSISEVKSLIINSKNISDMTGIKDFISLKQLECRNNQIRELSLTANSQLTELFCTNNKISSLDISGNPLLTALFCDQNQLTNLDLSKNKLLFTIGCGLNQLKNIDFSNNRELAYVSISNNILSNVDFTNNIKLILLHCWENKLSQLDLSQNAALVELDCSANQLVNLDLSANTSINSILAVSNKLKTLNLKNNKNSIIKTLSVINNTSLTCIQVDDVKHASSNVNWKKESVSSYAENCPPIIISISATTVCKGDSISILGANLTGTSSLSIGGFSIKSFRVVSPSKIIANVGEALSGSIFLSNAYGTATYSNLLIEKIPEVPSTIAGPNAVCRGQNAVIYSVPIISNATSYVWTFSNGYNASPSLNNITVNFGSNAINGTISVRGRNLCGDGPLASLPITVHPIPPTPKITLTDKLLRSDASQGNQWYNRSILISGATNQDYTVNSDGEYAVRVTANGCTSDFSNVIQFVVTATNNVIFQKEVLTFPNPISNYLEIKYNGVLGKIKYDLYTVNGVMVKSGLFFGEIKIYTQHLKEGIYLLKLSNGTTFGYRRIVKEK